MKKPLSEMSSHQRGRSVILLLLAFLLCLTACDRSAKLNSVSAEKEVARLEDFQFTEPVQKVLRWKLDLLDQLFQGKQLRACVENANTENRKLSMQEMLRRDKDWIEKQQGDLVFQRLITSECSQKLKTFQAEYVGYAEIFVTDERGFVVGLTNLTSDYYQADEAWWKRARQQGEAYMGTMDYDQSSKTQSIAIYKPVRDTRGHIIGIAKAVISTQHIEAML